jgi:hypothetical protein
MTAQPRGACGAAWDCLGQIKTRHAKFDKIRDLFPVGTLSDHASDKPAAIS